MKSVVVRKYTDSYSCSDPGGDARRSRPSWLTHSGQFFRKVVICQPQIGRRGKAAQSKTDFLTTEPRRQPKFACSPASGVATSKTARTIFPWT